MSDDNFSLSQILKQLTKIGNTKPADRHVGGPVDRSPINTPAITNLIDFLKQNNHQIEKYFLNFHKLIFIKFIQSEEEEFDEIKLEILMEIQFK